MPAFINDPHAKKIEKIAKKFVPGPPSTLINDPYKWKYGQTPYSTGICNLQYVKPEFKIPVPGEGLPRIINYCADQSGCAFWRMIWPANELLGNNKAVVMTLYQMVQFAPFYGGIDAIRLQRQCSDNQRDFVKWLRQISDEFKKQTGKGFKLIWEVDDVIFADCIPEYNACRTGFLDPKIEKIVKEIVHLCVAEDTVVNCVVDNVYMDVDMSELIEMFEDGRDIKILSKDIENDVLEFMPLDACVVTNDSAEVIEISDSESGSVLSCTPDHPIFTKNRGWVNAEDLSPNDILDIG